jgi:hypothetical protein
MSGYEFASKPLAAQYQAASRRRKSVKIGETSIFTPTDDPRTKASFSRTYSGDR